MQDFNKQDLAVGDTIVYAFAQGTTPYLRIGIIKEFITKKAPYGDRWVEKMRVEWQDTEDVFVSVGVWKTEPKIWTSLVEHSSRALKL